MSNAKSHPKGLYVLFVTEMWERFSYYGMRGIFSLFMIKALLFDKSFAASIYGNYTGLVYLTPLLGGYIADRYWGNRKSIFWGGILMAIGQFMLFFSALHFQDIANNPESFSLAKLSFYGGLGFLIFGNGFFKPNISTMVGQLYPKGDNRLDSAMTIFYMGINLGAFIAPLVAGGLGDTGCPEDFKWGFLAAALGMVISIIIFETLKNKYIVTPEGTSVGMPPSRKQVNQKLTDGNIDTPEEFKRKFNVQDFLMYTGLFSGLFLLFAFVFHADFLGAFMYSLTIVAPLSIIMDKSLTRIEKERIGVIYICAAFVIFFWSAFEQAGVSLTFFAEEQTQRYIPLLDWTMPASFFQSFNALFIVAFAPIAAWLWTWLGRKNMEPASPYKQSIGLFLLAVGYLFIAFGVKGIDPSTKVSMFWLIGLYWLHTIGELALSPIGLSMVVKLSPQKFTSLLMGIWFLSIATSNKLAGALSTLYPEEQKKEHVVPLEDKYGIHNLEMFNQSGIVWETVQPNNIPEQLPVWNIQMAEKDSIVKVEEPNGKTKEVKVKVISHFSIQDNGPSSPATDFKVRRILNENKLIATPAPAASAKPKNCETKDELGRFGFAQSENGDYLYVVRELDGEKNLQIWNLNPKRPSFFTFEIATLFDFFMIFVGLAGVASVILFFLSKKLLQMMNGIK
jgi:proton-dependent oligopeptide transporter, POT family